ncbi:dienelactone hydrolase family protein [Bradyrhizobium acaciae]|uniref:dienelactone hydrolase family protein n=1 Tax=Bradyrhizobium acaciae TaxID=2683706 RepID=UPI001E331C92|nr:dienelactone hydrolase family protein [Bradyrhizobium acaciae]MCC8983110.1 dienelactone hydrolase family protein [Bradyrhizobium acaciae]
MHTRDIDYAGGDAALRGYLAFKDTGAKRPGVLVFHEGLGLGDFAMERARRLAGHGYVALAADMFGERRQAADLQQAMTLIGDLRTNPAKLRARARAALATLIALPEVDAARCAAIGFCFGGTVALELARDGAELKAAVSFHGVLSTTQPAAPGAVRASVLVLTGADNPLAPSDQVTAFENEMRAGQVADWQVISYGNTLHGFANPTADGSIMKAALYDARADRRSWAAMQGLFDEVLV